MLGVDPGREKAGFALLDASGEVLEAGVVPVASVLERLRALAGAGTVAAIALGRGTNAASLAERLRGLGLPIHLVDEFETSRGLANSTSASTRRGAGGGSFRPACSCRPCRSTTMPRF